MPILENSFTCPKGHSFTANAKLRTRCPSCGMMTKRSFKEDTPTPEPVATPAPVEEKPKPKAKGPVLIKAGKTREPRAEVRKRKSLADQIREAKENAKMAKTDKEPRARVKKVSEGIVVKKRVSRNVTPRAGRRPPKTSVSKVTEYGGGGNERYWEKVAAKFTPRFRR